MSRLSALLLVSLLTPAPPLPAQSPAVTNPSPTSLLQNSLAALVGATTLSDITLTGTVRHIAGSTDETGTATLKALSAGASRVDFSFPSGPQTELLNFLAVDPLGSRSGSDGVSHPIALHNLLLGPSWFFPAFFLSRAVGPSGYVLSDVGPEIHNGQAVEHLSISQTWPLPDPPDVSFAHLTRFEVFLDSTSLLPAAISFNTHPDENALLDIPIEVRFSDWRTVSGSNMAFHIQEFLNNGLFLDITVNTVTINSGLSPAAFTVQASS